VQFALWQFAGAGERVKFAVSTKSVDLSMRTAAVLDRYGSVQTFTSQHR
jgi:hypothetical protein